MLGKFISEFLLSVEIMVGFLGFILPPMMFVLTLIFMMPVIIYIYKKIDNLFFGKK